MNENTTTAASRRLRTLDDACEYGGISRSKAYDLIRRGLIDAYKLDGLTMIDLDSLDRYYATLPKVAPRKDRR